MVACAVAGAVMHVTVVVLCVVSGVAAGVVAGLWAGVEAGVERVVAYMCIQASRLYKPCRHRRHSLDNTIYLYIAMSLDRYPHIN